MNWNAAPSGKDPARHGEREGIAGRVEAVSRMHRPAPRGRGIAMAVLAVAVLAALIWDFTGHSAVEKAMPGRGDDTPVVAPKAGDVDLSLPLSTEAGTVAFSASAAVKRLLAAPPGEREALRAQILAALAQQGHVRGRAAREAFELASRLVGGSKTAPSAAVDDLTRRAQDALADDEAAPAAILFLTRVPGGVDGIGARALDRIILDPSRPLTLRLEAARARPAKGRPPELEELARDPATHPALRAALR
jgi:hypothetical protein